MLLAWPALIVISWYAIRIAVNRYEKRHSREKEKMKD